MLCVYICDVISCSLLFLYFTNLIDNRNMQKIGFVIKTSFQKRACAAYVKHFQPFDWSMSVEICVRCQHGAKVKVKILIISNYELYNQADSTRNIVYFTYNIPVQNNHCCDICIVQKTLCRLCYTKTFFQVLRYNCVFISRNVGCGQEQLQDMRTKQLLQVNAYLHYKKAPITKIFSRRLRSIPQDQSKYVVNLDSIHVTDTAVEAELAKQGVSSLFKLTVTSLAGNTFRVFVDEVQPLHPRYKVEHVLDGEPKTSK